MKDILIPYNSQLFNIDTVVRVSFPRNSEIRVSEGKKIGYLTELVSYEKSDVLQSVPIDSNFRLAVFNGELVQDGSVLGERKLSRRRRERVKSEVSGVIKISMNRVDVVDVRKSHKVMSGVLGNVAKIDNIHNEIEIQSKGVGLPVAYLSQDMATSAILGTEVGAEVLSVKSFTKKLIDEVVSHHPQLLIFTHLSKTDFDAMKEISDNYSIPFCVIGTKKKGEHYEETVKLLQKVEGKRIAVQPGFLFCTGWKTNTSRKFYTKYKAGSLVIMTDFKQGPISCKIGKATGESIAVVKDGKRKKTSYLNILKT